MEINAENKKSQRSTGVRLRLSEHKVLLGLTWDEMAAATGIPRGHLIALDRGYAQAIDVRYIPGLASFLGVDFDDLVDGSVILPIKSRRPKRKTHPQ